ncbi:MAG TPA: RecX family transcriptional regulator [Gemmatimonadaceae bacterium]|nr:RecX family transcriptional regulator [Gemmatimonadaceae bacterium]
MTKIVTLTESGRREGRYLVELDDASSVTVSVEAISRLRLGPGRMLDEAELADLREEGEILVAYDRALDLLAFRPRSAVELRRRLVQKGIEAPRAEVAVSRLAERGLVDDRAFAVALTRSKALGAGASKRRVGQELARRGVAREVADAAVAEVWEEEGVDQSEVIEQLARKRLASLRGLDAPTQRRRLYGFLARRGYDADEIRRAMDAALGGDAAED